MPDNMGSAIGAGVGLLFAAGALSILSKANRENMAAAERRKCAYCGQPVSTIRGTLLCTNKACKKGRENRRRLI